ncbi:hypothetical protein [Nonomuraea antimicrobica]|uniref:hypothetical protein n=1 Tax=Nonomuraea antimicrobica TaxID=561173 RepID=UPI0031EADE40
MTSPERERPAVPFTAVAMCVTRGVPTLEEWAPLVVALHLVRSAPVSPPVRRGPRRLPRGPLLPGPDGWRESSWSLGGQL